MAGRNYSGLPDPERDLVRECVELSDAGSYLRVRSGELPPNYVLRREKETPSGFIGICYFLKEIGGSFVERIFRGILG